MRYARIEKGYVAEIRREGAKGLSPSLRNKYVPCDEGVKVGFRYSEGNFYEPKCEFSVPEGAKEELLYEVLCLMAKEYLGIGEALGTTKKNELSRMYGQCESSSSAAEFERLKKEFKEKLKKEKKNGK